MLTFKSLFRRINAAAASIGLVVGGIPSLLRGQAGFDDDRVLLQGFYWESYRHGHPEKFFEYGTKNWYTIVRENTAKIREGLLDLIWLPPPSFAGHYSAGYNPKELYNLGNSYGSDQDHRSMLHSLLKNGIEPVADLVLNHRDGTSKWTDFKNPTWGLWSICTDDECFSNPSSEAFGAPVNQRGASEQTPSYRQGSNYQYGSFRDIDHTNATVRRDTLRYLLQLKSAGYRGWRYDMVHGYDASWLALYNKHSAPTFSVGEYDWDKHSQQRGWIWSTATVSGDLKTSSNVFDFSTQFTLKDNKGNYARWYGYGNGPGMIGDTTDNLPWKNRAVTFLENHDSGYRTNEDGTPEHGHQSDCFANSWEVEQGYAFILTHPGIPTVYWKHYFDWGSSLQAKLKALINARKVAGVKSGSAVHAQKNAQTRGVYAAMVQGQYGQLYVRIGGNDGDWQPHFSNYHDYQDYAHGAGWKVWIALPGNPNVQHATPRPGLPVPEYREPSTINIPDDWIDPL